MSRIPSRLARTAISFVLTADLPVAMLDSMDQRPLAERLRRSMAVASERRLLRQTRRGAASPRSAPTDSNSNRIESPSLHHQALIFCLCPCRPCCSTIPFRRSCWTCLPCPSLDPDVCLHLCSNMPPLHVQILDNCRNEVLRRPWLLGPMRTGVGDALSLRIDSMSMDLWVPPCPCPY